MRAVRFSSASPASLLTPITDGRLSATNKLIDDLGGHWQVITAVLMKTAVNLEDSTLQQMLVTYFSYTFIQKTSSKFTT